MTLISIAYSNLGVGVSTDTQLTYMDDGTPAGDAVKSLYFRCADGIFLAAYTGNNVYLEDGIHVADWVTNLLSDADIGKQQVNDIIKTIVVGLNDKHYDSKPASLVILVAGFKIGESKNIPIVYRITNVGESSDLTPKQSFSVFMSSNEIDVIVDGSIRVGMDESFDNKVDSVKDRLENTTLEDFGDTIGKALYELNQIAHNHPTQGKYIGDNTMFSFIRPLSDGMDTWRYPEHQTTYMLPNFNNGSMSVRGIVIYNDLLDGGTIKMDTKSWPPSK